MALKPLTPLINTIHKVIHKLLAYLSVLRQRFKISGNLPAIFAKLLGSFSRPKEKRIIALA
jgi:hypothetical protein